jgi:phenylalanyl-tRNA synthetase beta chain
VQFVDEYRGAGVAAGQKSITIRLRIGADDKTLTSKEINDAATRAVDSLKQQLAGELRVS